MAERLEDALRATLRGWRSAVAGPWKDALEPVSPDFGAVAGHRIEIDPWVPIFPPVRKRRNMDILGAPREAEICRALRLVSPGNVRVVVVGQDPYPDVAKATGTSFEQGDLRDWVRDAGRVSSSLRAVLQNAAADKTGDDRYRDARSGGAEGRRGWKRVVRALEDGGDLSVARPNQLFQRYAEQGVLWLNTTLTISLFRWEPNHQKAHADLWRPIVGRLFRRIAQRSNRHAVFALWGSWAKSFEDEIQGYAEDAGTDDRVAFARAQHPVTDSFLTRVNPLTSVNDRLADLGEARIRWLPG